MSSSFDRYQKRRLISSYFSVVLSIALVLFLLGMLGLFVLNAKKMADRFKEKIAMTIFLKDDAKDVEIQQLQKTLAMADYAKEALYVSKEDAAERHMEDLGENFIDYLGYNPLKNSFDLYLKANYVHSDSIADIAQQLHNKAFVEEVSYDKPLVALINENINRVSFWVLIASAVFTVIAMLLINSSIRLAVYARRFIIKTMQMVGATKSFIRRPFILKSVSLGVIGAAVASIAVGIALYYLNQRYAELELTEQPLLLVALFLSLFLLGILITWLSTFIATQRFLNLRTDDLYY